MRVIHVLRKPLSEGSVAANTLKHGAGGLNVNTSRIGTHKRVPTSLRRIRTSDGFSVRGFSDGSLRNETGDEDGWNPNVGRFPANVILQHLDGCRCEGVKKVKPSNGSGTAVRHRGVKDSNLYGGGIGSLPVGTPDLGYTDKDGTETVTNWICEPGCPVARLDEQSGVLAPQGGQKHKDTKEGSFLETGFGGSATSTFYGDTGGASRFFKQVGGNRVE